VAACVALGARQVAEHAAERNRLPLTEVRLWADAIPVLSPGAGRIVRVAVTPQHEVRRGQLLLIIRTVNPATGAQDTHRVKAPAAGRLLDVKIPQGSSVRSGDPVVELYDPRRLSFRAQLASDRLSEVVPGMQARLRLPSGTPTEARVVRLEPQLVPYEPDNGEGTIVLEPLRPDRVRNLVPGLAFDGWLERDSAPRNARSLLGD
jgi:biotin carboxyl carrier protein